MPLKIHALTLAKMGSCTQQCKNNVCVVCLGEPTDFICATGESVQWCDVLSGPEDVSFPERIDWFETVSANTECVQMQSGRTWMKLN